MDEAIEVARRIKLICGDRLHSIIVYGSAARGVEKPGDLDILVVIDPKGMEIRDIRKQVIASDLDIELSKKYGVYPEIFVLGKERIGKGSPMFYYSIINDGVPIVGEKEIFEEALKRIGKSNKLIEDFLERRKRANMSLGKANKFLREAEKLLDEKESLERMQLAAEGAYRACVEALYALFIKHSLPVPHNHIEEMERLDIIERMYPGMLFKSRYREMMSVLNDDCFYHGDCPKDLEHWLGRVRQFIQDVEEVV